MTTGRINQKRRRDIELLVARQSSRLHSASGRATYAARAIRFPPLDSPGLPSTAPNPLWEVWLRGPQEEDLARCFYHFGVRSEWLPPDAQFQA
ncbi:hypothetical protein FPOAC1_012833 [Fusarium poae]|nr:hypothetical protein FPOAC1_012833 [Fusarium poae]